MTLPDRHDVVVVGARAAGAATALLLARLGHDVVLVDRARFPSDALSTHQLSRPGVVQLRRWGLLKAGVDLYVAPRRYVLGTILAEAAARAGVRLRLGVTVDGVRLDDTGRAVGVYGHDDTGAPVDIAARFVVGADGLHSRVARPVGAEIVEDRGAGGASQYAYFAGLPWDGIELVVGDRSLTGVFPTHHGEACVWISGPARALVGDAGYHRDPVTGHGLSDAYLDAELLDLTCAMVAYPSAHRFAALQTDLARALDTEAADLAARDDRVLAAA
jgi:2-polyprenyl-6-methoxyphenol hydroxylase-like FAD-dependent oxidoreductase